MKGQRQPQGTDSPLLHNFSLVPNQHPGQANHIYLGEWNRTLAAIRIPNANHASVNEFYDGVQDMFQLNLYVPYHYYNMYQILKTYSSLTVPKLLSLHPLTPKNITPAHEYVDGTPCRSFAELSFSGARAFGRHLATLHCTSSTYYGRIGHTHPASSFHQTMRQAMSRLLGLYSYDAPTVDAANVAIDTLSRTPKPTTFAPIMLDLDPTQYFLHDGQLTHLIDLDFYVFAPPELELVSLEPLLPPHLHDAFATGYTSIRPLPQLKAIRQPYRAFNRLICVQGEQPYAKWSTAHTL